MGDLKGFVCKNVTVNQLLCSTCNSLKSLVGMPEHCEELICINCEYLTDFTGISTDVEYLDCTYCTSLKSFIGIGNKCKSVVADGCKKLIDFKDLPESVEKLQINHIKPEVAAEYIGRPIEINGKPMNLISNARR